MTLCCQAGGGPWAIVSRVGRVIRPALASRIAWAFRRPTGPVRLLARTARGNSMACSMPESRRRSLVVCRAWRDSSNFSLARGLSPPWQVYRPRCEGLAGRRDRSAGPVGRRVIRVGTSTGPQLTGYKSDAFWQKLFTASRFRSMSSVTALGWTDSSKTPLRD